MDVREILGKIDKEAMRCALSARSQAFSDGDPTDTAMEKFIRAYRTAFLEALTDDLSAANLTIEADWNTDMDAAPRGEPGEYVSFLAYWPSFSSGGADYTAFQAETWLAPNGRFLCAAACLDPLWPVDWQPTAWKPLNPPGEG